MGPQAAAGHNNPNAQDSSGTGFASEVYGDWKQTSKNNGGPASGSGSNLNLANKLTRANNLSQMNG